MDAAAAAIRVIRKAKSEARLPQKAAVSRLVVTGTISGLELLEGVLGDVVAAGNVGAVEMVTEEGSDDGSELSFEVTV
jgi:Na+/H+-translocating membrane pyrophosphatase